MLHEQLSLFFLFLLPFLCGQFIDGMLCKNFMSNQIDNAHRGNSSFCLANLFTNGRHRNAKAFPRGPASIFLYNELPLQRCWKYGTSNGNIPHCSFTVYLILLTVCHAVTISAIYLLSVQLLWTIFDKPNGINTVFRPAYFGPW
uniref:Secreted protein n=1 Tax=Ixodes ricinus TaxID=34613 RepID=A0A6B0UTY2_IXORI